MDTHWIYTWINTHMNTTIPINIHLCIIWRIPLHVHRPATTSIIMIITTFYRNCLLVCPPVHLSVCLFWACVLAKIITLWLTYSLPSLYLHVVARSSSGPVQFSVKRCILSMEMYSYRRRRTRPTGEMTTGVTHCRIYGNCIVAVWHFSWLVVVEWCTLYSLLGSLCGMCGLASNDLHQKGSTSQGWI